MNKKNVRLKSVKRVHHPQGNLRPFLKSVYEKKTHKRWNLLGDLFHMVSFENITPKLFRCTILFYFRKETKTNHCKGFATCRGTSSQSWNCLKVKCKTLFWIKGGLSYGKFWRKKATPKFFVYTCLFCFRGFIPLKTAKLSDNGFTTRRITSGQFSNCV